MSGNWDWSRLEEVVPKLENLVALHLLKYYQEPWIAIEVKTKETKLSGSLVYFKEKLQIPYCYQIVHHSQDDFIKGGIRIMPIEKFLTALI